MKRNKKNLFCNCSHAFNSPLFSSNIMIFYLNLFKATKFALIVIDMNRPAPNLPNNTFFLLQARTVPRNQIKDSSSHLLQCSSCFDFFAITADMQTVDTTSYVIFCSQASIVSWGLVCSYRSL